MKFSLGIYGNRNGIAVSQMVKNLSLLEVVVKMLTTPRKEYIYIKFTIETMK